MAEKEHNGKRQQADPTAHFAEASSALVTEIERDIREAGNVNLLFLAGEVRMLRIGFRTLIELLAKHGTVQLPEWDKVYTAAIERETQQIRAQRRRVAVPDGVAAALRKPQ